MLAEAAAEHQALDDTRIRLGLDIEQIERRQAQHAGDVAQVVARRDRDQRRLDTGQVGSPRELQNLQSEIEALARRQAVLEDAELEVMEELEVAEARRAELVARLEDTAARGTQARTSRDAAWTEIDAEAAEASAERERVAGEVPDDLRELYERLRAQLGGVGAAALLHGRCEGCRLQVDPADARRYAAAAPEEVLRCGECRRILVRPAGRES